jgi:uncharacterized protein involved in propanediol utilization
MVYSAKIYSRIGELMQGFLPDASGFLVSGFASRIFFSEAVLTPGGGDPGEGGSLPAKSRLALATFRDLYETDGVGLFSVRLQSNIPPGKGLSSSSTDILSVLFVVNDYLRAGCRPEELYRIAAAIEPTDPCLSDDVVVFKQHAGIVDRCVSLPPMTILYFDAEPGRQIDTLDVQRPWTPGTGKFYDWLLRRFLQAAKAGDYDTLFDCITYSAEYNQTVIPLAGWDGYLQLARTTQSGLMVAHSGTIVGLLTRPQQAAELRARLQTATSQPIYSEQYISSTF